MLVQDWEPCIGAASLLFINNNKYIFCFFFFCYLSQLKWLWINHEDVLNSREHVFFFFNENYKPID
jgi:hypothetical protein